MLQSGICLHRSPFGNVAYCDSHLSGVVIGKVEIPGGGHFFNSLVALDLCIQPPEVKDKPLHTPISSQRSVFTSLIQLKKIKTRLLNFTADEAERFKKLLTKLTSVDSQTVDGVSINALANALIFEVWHQSNKDQIFTSKDILKGISSGALHLGRINRIVSPEDINLLRGLLEPNSETSHRLTRNLEYFFERALTGRLSIGRRFEIVLGAPLTELVILPGLFSRVGLSHVPISAPDLLYRAALHLLVVLESVEHL